MQFASLNFLRLRKKNVDAKVDYYELCNSRLGPTEMNYHFSMSLRKQYFYCEVSKAGCSQIKSTLWRSELADTPLPKEFWKNNWDVHRNFTNHLLIKPFQLGKSIFNDMMENDKIVKWTVVRNPYTRLLSGYLDKVKRNTSHFNSLRPHIARQRGVSVEDVAGENVTYLEFCRAIAAVKNPSNLDQHWRPQYWHTCSDIIRYNLVGKLEEIRIFEERLGRAVGVKDLGFSGGRGHRTNATEQLREHYCDEAKRIVDAVYSNDFDHFGYSRVIPF